MTEMKFYPVDSKKDKVRSNNVTAIFPQKRTDETLPPQLCENTNTQTVIHIFGRNILQNDLLKNYFEKQANFSGKWITHFEIDLIQQANDVDTQVILVDCYGISLDEIWLHHNDIFRLNIMQYKLLLMNLLNPCDRYFEQDAIRKGIKGVFYQGETADTLLKGVEKILEGELWFSRKTTSRLLSETNTHIHANKNIKISLTAREREILGHLSSGACNIEIAEKFCISLNTVKTHIHHIYKKIGVRNRLEATLWTAKHQ